MHVRRRVPQSAQRRHQSTLGRIKRQGSRPDPQSCPYDTRAACAATRTPNHLHSALSPTSKHRRRGAQVAQKRPRRQLSERVHRDRAVSPHRQHPQSGNDKPPAPVRGSIRASWQSRAVKLWACHDPPAAESRGTGTRPCIRRASCLACGSRHGREMRAENTREGLVDGGTSRWAAGALVVSTSCTQCQRRIRSVPLHRYRCGTEGAGAHVSRGRLETGDEVRCTSGNAGDESPRTRAPPVHACTQR
ncbi:hypothetical protein K466DRAFT_393319 [Polyporus arcularius HHB13444]|uniref:Uncharacterized protein n=1 Tax=Polyporus arcularius HHB13444 TaxID=1314778 RepID=A0A5C3PR42_9APHY|nr:hypothetical protein K466DRAFT_393319 [Polyporus arcularius HHB13444]